MSQGSTGIVIRDSRLYRLSIARDEDLRNYIQNSQLIGGIICVLGAQSEPRMAGLDDSLLYR
jgi:hypothetical protein